MQATPELVPLQDSPSHSWLPRITMLGHACDRRTRESETEGKFQASLSDVVRPCLKNKQKNHSEVC
jgi:hypothetical protein